jgi:hypothetical protein
MKSIYIYIYIYIKKCECFIYYYLVENATQEFLGALSHASDRLVLVEF